MTSHLSEQELRDRLRGIASWATPVQVPPLPDSAVVLPWTEPEHRRRRARPLFWIATAAALIGVVLTVATIDQGERTGVAQGTWSSMAPAPIPSRSLPAAVWTGREVVVVGGEAADGTTRRDAAAYDPLVNRWRRLPDVPVDVHPGATALWTGQEVIVLGTGWLPVAEVPPGTRGVVSPPPVAFDPVAGSWRTLASPDPVMAGAVVDGRVVVMVQENSERALVRELDPSSDSWRDVLALPPGLVDLNLVRDWIGLSAGSQAIFVAQDWVHWGVDSGAPMGFVVEHTTGEWRPIPVPPAMTSRNRPLATTHAVVGTDGTVTLVGVLHRNGGSPIRLARRFPLANPTWQIVEAADGYSLDGTLFRASSLTAVGRDVVLLGGIESGHTDDAGAARVVYRAETRRWQELPEPGIDLARVGHIAVWTGEELVVWGGLVETSGSGNRPDRPASGGELYRVEK